MDSTLYVRIEGVNLANFVSDVHDLSTIRGGSFLLLEAVERVRIKFNLNAIATGASSGLFTAASEDDAGTLRDRIEVYLGSEDKQLKHATFVVDVFRGDDSDAGFLAAREGLAAMNRWRQLQQPTVSVPSPAEVQEECALDHVRPGSEEIWLKDGDKVKRYPASASVKARRDFGRDKKTSFYLNEMKALRESGPEDQQLDALIERLSRPMPSPMFTLDIEELSDDKSAKSLDGKIAILYFDGNRFGSIQRGCKEPADLRAFDTTVKNYRRTALRRLLDSVLDSIDEQKNGWFTKDDRIRLETLLWGGDELTWVVPAWKGWSVLQLFYGVSRDWEFKPVKGGVKPLTHAGGAVFCHRAAPIHRMTELAKKLADSCKKTFDVDKPPSDHASRDVFAYQVLESFDHIGTEFDEFRAKRVPPGGKPSELMVHAAGMAGIAASFDTVKRRFPRSKLHTIVSQLRDGEVEKAEATIDKTAGELQPEALAALASLFAFFAPNVVADPLKNAPTAWFHIAELWDYAI